MNNSNTGKKCTSGLNYSYSLLHSNISIDFKPKCFSCDFAMRQKSLYRPPTSLTGHSAGIYLSKTAMETPKQDVKSVQSYNLRHQNCIMDVALVPLSLSMWRFVTLF